MFKIFVTDIVEEIFKMKLLEISGAVRTLQWQLGVKGLKRYTLALLYEISIACCASKVRGRVQAVFWNVTEY
jgi:hypothetical protein